MATVSLDGVAISCRVAGEGSTDALLIHGCIPANGAPVPPEA